MAPLSVHAITGMALQEAGGVYALPLAVWTHWPFDDLNWGRLVWYHGLGTGWHYWAAVAGYGLSLALVGYALYRRPLLLPGAMAASWADIEHLLCWTVFRERHSQGLHWIHDGMWPSWLGTEWGLLAWMAVAAVGVLTLYGVTKRRHKEAVI